MASFVPSALSGDSPFKRLEKLIKEHKHVSEVENTIIDLSNLSSGIASQIVYHKCQISLYGEVKDVYGFHGYEGFYVIKNSLPLWLQIEMAHLALADCPQPPNTTSLGLVEGAGVWNHHKNILAEIDIHNHKELCEQTLALRSSPLGHIRWSALGFQYDWTARKYPQTFSQEKPHTTPPPRPVPEQIFPPNLSSVVKTIISSLAHQSVTSFAPELNMTIEPEASIVNYCMPGSFMGGHVDDAELTHDHPVVSMSLGRPCAFIVGGLTKEDPAIAVLLRSGDTVLLSQKSRLCYHGVSRIFDCPYTSNYRRESGKKRGRCSASCLPICCENPSLRTSPVANGGESEVHSSSSSCYPQNMDEFLWKNEVTQETLHSSLEGIHCPKRRDRTDQGKEQEEKERSGEGEVCSGCHQSLLSKDEERRVLNYLRLSRINLNVRQVYPSPTNPNTELTC